jgi:hypothetical protein
VGLPTIALPRFVIEGGRIDLSKGILVHNHEIEQECFGFPLTGRPFFDYKIVDFLKIQKRNVWRTIGIGGSWHQEIKKGSFLSREFWFLGEIVDARQSSVSNRERNYLGWRAPSVYGIKRPKTGRTLRDGLNNDPRPLCVDDRLGIQQSCIGVSGSMLNNLFSLSSRADHLSDLFFHGLPLQSHVIARSFHLVSLPLHNSRLAAINPPREEHHNQLQDADDSQHPCKYLHPPLYLYVLCLGVSVGLTSVGDWLAGGQRVRAGWCLGIIGAFSGGCVLSTLAFGNPIFLWSLQWLGGKSHGDNCNGEYHGIIVTQKHLTTSHYCNTVIGMANVLNPDKQIAVIGALAEGSSIRSSERITGVHRDQVSTSRGKSSRHSGV